MSIAGNRRLKRHVADRSDGKRDQHSGAARSAGTAPLSSSDIDRLYGLEPVYEPDSRQSALESFEPIRCPSCGESYDTHIDLVSGSQSYIEDCQICCRPILLQIEIRHGSLKSLKYSGLEDA